MTVTQQALRTEQGYRLVGPGYQVPFAGQARAAGPELEVAKVGLITAPEQAEDILAYSTVGAVLLAREALRDSL